jgi:AraC-like DNA-binding protein
VDAVVVQFMPNLLGDDWLRRPSMAHLATLFHRSLLGLEPQGILKRRMTRRVLEIAESTGLQRVILLLQMLEEMAHSEELEGIASPGFHQTANAHSSDRIGWVVAFIEEHLAQPIYVPALAQKAGLSESAFSRLFKQNTGRTIPHYINELRIARACRLLAETDQTVGEIADACGYPNRAHFQRQFHRLEKRSPLAYRSAVRKPK